MSGGVPPPLEEAEEEDAVLVGGPLGFGLQPPVVLEPVPSIDADHDVGVADVDGEEHGLARITRHGG